MAAAIDGLAKTLGTQLHGLEELSRQQGLKPGRDMDLGGLRIAIARGEVAAALLFALSPYEAEFRDWFAIQVADRIKPVVATAGSN